MENKLYSANQELIDNFNTKNKVQDKLGKLGDLNIKNISYNIPLNEKFLYGIIGNYFVSVSNPDVRNIFSAGWSNFFRNAYEEQLQDLSKLDADMSNYPKELGELLN